MTHGYFRLLLAFLLLGACASQPASPPPADDPLTGNWSGDYGPDSTRRDPVALELHWDGTNLRGTVNPGPRGLELTKASFNKETGAINMEFDAFANGNTVHFVIEGKVNGDTITGDWHRGNQKGDFRVTKD